MGSLSFKAFKKILLALTLGALCACRAELNNPAEDGASAPAQGLSGLTELTVFPSAATLYTYGLQVFSGAGGVPPYSFSVQNGGGGVNASGQYTAPSSAGSAVVRLTDSVGAFAEASILITLPSTPGPTQLELSGSTALTADTCSGAYTVTSRDGFGNATPVASSTTVSLGGAGSGSLYSDSACTVAVTSVSILTGAFSQTFYFKDPVAQSVTLTADAAGLTQGVYSVTVSPAPATKLAVSGPVAVVVGACSSAYSVFSKDSQNNTTNVASDTVVALAGAGSGSFYGDSSCSTSITQVTLTGGTSSKVFYLKDAATESLTVSVSAAGLTSGALGVTITASAPTQMGLTGPSTIATGACSAYTVRSEDGGGTPSNVGSNLPVTLSGNGFGLFFSDAACTISTGSVVILAGGNSSVFYYRNTAVQAATFTADATGLSQGTFPVTIAAASPSRLLLSSSATVVAGSCSSALTVTSQDPFGNASNVTAPATVTLGGAGLGAFYGDGSCTGAVGSVVISTGTSNQTFYFKSSAAQSLSLTADSAGFTQGSASLSVVGDTAANLALAGPTSLVSGVCSAAFSVALRDSMGNSAVAGSPTSVSLGGGGSGAFYSDSACTSAVSSVSISAGSASSSFYFKGSAVQNLTLTADSVLLAQGNVAVSVAAGTPSRLTLSGLSAVGIGLCSSAYTVSTLDASNNPAVVATNTVLSLSGSGSGAFHSDSGCNTAITQITIGSGSGSGTFYLKDTVGESLTLAADATGFSQGSYGVTVTVPPPSKLLLSGSPSVFTGECGAYTVTSADSGGTPANLGANTTIALAGNGSGFFYGDAACTGAVISVTIASGTSSQNLYFRSTAPESELFTADATGLTQGTYPVTVAVAPPTRVAWSGPSSLTAGTCSSAYALTTQDAYGNASAISGNTVFALGGVGSGSFHSDSSCSSPVVSVTVGASTSTTSVYFKDSSPQALTLTADSAGFTQGTYSVTVSSAPPTKLVLGGPISTKVSTCSTAFTVTSQDASSNPSNVSVATTVTLGGGGSGAFYSDASCSVPVSDVTIPAGNSAGSFYFKDSVGESLILTVSATGLTSGTLPTAIYYPVLYLSGTGGSTLDGAAITSCGGGSICNSANPYVVSTDAYYSSVTLENGAYLTGVGWTTGAPTAGNGMLRITVQNDFLLNSGCVITMNAKGYTGGNGPGTGVTTSGGAGGGSYGGTGGNGSTTASLGSYGSLTGPAEPGSGGGTGDGGAGGAGGGMIRINVGSQLMLNGIITANGANSATGGGGGAGGGIDLTVSTLAGSSGALSANGGNGIYYAGDRGGGGGGGRIAIAYSADSFTGGIGAVAKTAYGGAINAAPAQWGGAGTIFHKRTGFDPNGYLIVNNNGNSGATTPLLSSTSLDGLTLLNSANLDNRAGFTLSWVSANFSGGTLTNNGTLSNALATISGYNLVNYGTITIPGNNLIIGAGGTLTWGNGTLLSLSNLTIESGGVLTHLANGSSINASLNLSVSNNLQIDAGGAINLDGKGYAGGYGAGAGGSGGSYGGGGGAHGGNGGIGNGGALGGSSYDSLTNPVLAGSGGGAGYDAGAAGGGLGVISVGNQLTLNGSITANGASSTTDSGGGAGGTVNIVTSILAGSGGLVRVNGGNGAYYVSDRGGGGGGGRIALVYTTDSYVGGIANLSKTAFGGTIYSSPAQPGGAGTVFYKHSGVDANGHLLVDNNGVEGASTPLLASMTFDSLTAANAVSLDNRSGSTLLWTTAAFSGATLINNGTLSNSVSTISGYNLVNYGTITIPGNNLIIGAGGTLTWTGTGPLSLSNLTIESGGVLTHLANGSTLNAALNLSLSNNLQIDAGGAINLDGKGYAGGYGAGAGGSTGSFDGGGGGAHGANGGYSGSGAAGGSAYDSLTNPVLAGSGGGAGYGGAGAAGGGLGVISVGNQLTLNGSITANGVSSTTASGGGAGGTVNIVTSILAGSGGLVRVNGGNGTYYSLEMGGGGGGGRIALVYTTDSYVGGIASLTKTAFGGITYSWPAQPGGAGTVFYKHSGVDANGHLLVDNNGVAGATTPLLASMTFDSVTAHNSGNLENGAGFTLQWTTADFAGGAITNNGTLGNAVSTISGGNWINNGTIVFTAGNLTIASGSTLTWANNTPLSLNNLTIQGGGTLTHSANVSSMTASLNLNVSNDLQIDSGGAINVDGKGFSVGNGPGTGAPGGSGGSGGGAYGGNGGNGTYAGGGAYGSLFAPAELGSGAGLTSGMAGFPGGGGLAVISVGHEFILNGTISSDGGSVTSSSNSRGGGSGGGINITTDIFSGNTGLLRANGGNGYSQPAGGGGGGRIALTYTTDLYSGSVSALPKTAYGGTASSGARGGAGTIYVKHAGVDVNGFLLVDNNSVTGALTPLLATTTLDGLTVQNKANLENKAGFTLTAAAEIFANGVLTNRGAYNPPSSTLGSGFELINYGTVNFPGNTLIIPTGTTLTVANNSLSVGDLTIQSGGGLTHLANTTSQAYVLNVTVSNNMAVDMGGIVDVTGKGYAGGYGGGAGTGAGLTASWGTGGGHGGAGGRSSSSATVGAAYDSDTNPVELGSGGGNSSSQSCSVEGGAGGGYANVNVTGTLTLNGTILSNGAVGACQGGSGSGGTIKVVTGTVAGSSGVMRADGGDAYSTSAGSGGGGRIKLSYTTDSFSGGVGSLLRTANPGTLGNGPAGAGTVQ